MRFLYVIHYPVFGGPHNQALRLKAPLLSRGWETLVLLPHEDGNATRRLIEGGVEVVEAKLHRARAAPNPASIVRWLGNWPGDVLRLQRVIRSRDIDLVMFCSPINFQPIAAAMRSRLPVVCQIVDTRTPPWLRRVLMPLIFHLSDAVLSTGNSVAAVHPGVLSLGDRLVTYFPPVDTSIFAPSNSARSLARLELGIGPTQCVIGTVGNLNPMKGHSTFLRAAANLRRTHPGTVFLIMGAEHPTHPHYLSGIRALARELGLEQGHDLFLIDPEARVAKLVQAIDVFWLTSEPHSEGMPTVIAEAMALGIPVVATDVGGVREMVSNGTTGYVVPPRDPSAIASATARILDDSALQVAMARESVLAAASNFNLEACADAHVRAFEAAMSHVGR